MTYDIFYYHRCALELEELERSMTNEQLDAVEIHEERKRQRIAEESEY